MNQGFISKDEYESLFESSSFKMLESYSNTFLHTNISDLKPFAKKWVVDSFHQAGRIWEYPFVFEEISQIIQAKGKNTPLNILDAGSGITFFPYFIKNHFPNVNATCVDIDPILEKLFAKINGNMNVQIDYRLAGMHQMPLQNESIDIIYCISVLEHTKNYEDIVNEFHRVLKPGGRLIVTFDISIDGRADIPLTGAKKLASNLLERLKSTNPEAIEKLYSITNFDNTNIITTKDIWKKDPSLLPWSYPRLSGALASIKKGKFPSFDVKQITFACLIFEK